MYTRAISMIIGTHWFNLVSSDPDSESELSTNPNWYEVHYPINSLSDIYSTHTELSEKQLHLDQASFDLEENNEINATIGQLSVSLPELLGKLTFTLDSNGQTDSTPPVSLDENGTLRALVQFDYEGHSEIYLDITVSDRF